MAPHRATDRLGAAGERRISFMQLASNDPALSCGTPEGGRSQSEASDALLGGTSGHAIFD